MLLTDSFGFLRQFMDCRQKRNAAQTRKFLLPIIKGGLRHAHLSADFSDAGAGFGLFQRKCNLFFGITGLFMAMCPSLRWKKDRRLQFSLALF